MSMNVKNDEERKTKVIKLRLNESEYAKLKRYTEESGMRSMSEYVYNSILATPIIEITDEELSEPKERTRTIADRINAIAKRVNQTDKFYPEDLREIKQGISEIQNLLAEFQAKLESLAVTPKTFRAIVDKAHDDVKSKLSKK